MDRFLYTETGKIEQSKKKGGFMPPKKLKDYY